MDTLNCLKQLISKIIVMLYYNIDLEFNLLLYQTGFG